MNAPIALFVYNRSDHLRQTVEALRRNRGAKESSLHVFSDAPRNDAATKGVAEVRRYLRSIDGFRSVQIVERQSNLGLAGSIIDGVTRLCEENGRVIVVEDDLVTSPHFLAFMNDGLDFYEGNEEVASIHGYIYPVQGTLPETFFLRGADCWGWATWKRAWSLFNPDGKELLRQLEESGLTRSFDVDGTYPYTRMLRNQIAGRNNSWAIRWHASAFLRNRLTLYPGRSLVSNIGTDGSGTHCEVTDTYASTVSEPPVVLREIPVAEDTGALSIIADFHRSSRPSLIRRVTRKLLRHLGGGKR